MKRAFDIAAGAAALILVAPILGIVAVIIRVTMGSPVIFRQARAGKYGVPFDLYKFRTMRAARPNEVGPAHDVARTTTVGRFLRRTSIDELPSLCNVLRGELSLVGPRPLPMSYVARYTEQQARRLDVRPGLTGWAVIHGRNQLGWDERFELDCWYVDHQTFLLDMRVIVRTVALVLRGTNVNHAEDVTMTEFLGGDS